jgi:superfamily II DNA or RNA helicase
VTDLRPYQARAVEQIRAAWDAGAERVLCVAPTGSGKTVIGAAATAGLDALWLAHRRELVAQAPGRATTVQALLDGHRPPAEVLVLDEAHHYAAGAPAWLAVASSYPRILGLTATPQRADGSALGDLFERLVVAAHYSELIAGGWLVRARVYRPPEELEGLAQRPEAAWRQWAQGRRGFLFFSRVDDAREAADALPEALAVWGEQAPEERDAALAAFREGTVTALCNVAVLTEGVDVPEASACLLACGCDHAGSYLQRVGRVLRPAPGKTDAIVVDLPGVSHRWGLPDEDRMYSLEGRPIRAKLEPLTTCQVCGSTYPSADGACPDCGWQRPPEPHRVRIWGIPLTEAGAVLADPQLDPAQRARLAWRMRMAGDDAARLRWFQGKGWSWRRCAAVHRAIWSRPMPAAWYGRLPR